MLSIPMSSWTLLARIVLVAGQAAGDGAAAAALERDYKRAEAGFSEVTRLYPNAEGGKSPSAAARAARAAHLAGDLARAREAIAKAEVGIQEWVYADQSYTLGRICE